MAPDVAAAVDAMLSATVDEKNTVDVRCVAEAAFSILCWALSRCPDEAERDCLLDTFDAEIALAWPAPSAIRTRRPRA